MTDPEVKKRIEIVCDWFEAAEHPITLQVEVARSLAKNCRSLLSAIETKPPFNPKTDDPLGPGISQGLLIVAADALLEIRKKVLDRANPLLIFEHVDEATAAIVHELEAQAEDIAWLISQRTDPTTDPEKISAILRRTLGRRRLR